MKSWSILMKIFLALLTDYCYDWKFFLLFWDWCRCFEPIWKKKKLKIWKKFPKIFNFWNFICGSAAEISADRPKIPSKIFFCPKFLPKKFWVKSDHYIIKISKKSTPPPKKMAIFGGGGRTLFVMYPSKVLNWKPETMVSATETMVLCNTADILLFFLW